MLARVVVKTGNVRSHLERLFKWEHNVGWTSGMSLATGESKYYTNFIQY